jgi:hypothetical protein
MERLLVPSARTDTRSAIKQSADMEAVQIFAQNPRELFPPASEAPSGWNQTVVCLAAVRALR